MKVWKRLKIKVDRAIQNRVWEKPVQFTRLGYYRRRPFLVPTSGEIGHIESVRFVVSPL